MRRTMALLALLLLALAPAATAAVERPLNADLVGAFTFGACPASAPAGALCLHDHVSGPMSSLGDSTGEFDVVIDAASSRADGCAPADKRGFFVTANHDRLDVTAHGTYCFSTSVASYVYTVAGGSGRLAGATGTGSWLVPAPSTLNGTGGVGDEHLHGTIAYAEPSTVISPGPGTKTHSEPLGRLRLGRIDGPAGRKNHPRLQARVFSNGQELHGVVVTIHCGSSRGRTIGRSGRFNVANGRVVSVRLVRPLRRGHGYVAVAVGQDRAGHGVAAVRRFVWGIRTRSGRGAADPPKR